MTEKEIKEIYEELLAGRGAPREYIIGPLGAKARQAFDEAIEEACKKHFMNTQEQTLGESRVRVSFNPSEDSIVDQIKRDTAALIDKVDTIPGVGGGINRLKALAQTAYEEAAMWAVKAATYGK